jgi:hypothetical protein
MEALAFLAATALLLGCSAGEEETMDPGEDPRAASPEGDHLPAPTLVRVDPPVLDADQRRRQAEVERYVAERYRAQGWRIVETTQTYVGDIVDWLDPSSVPGSQIEPPPRPSPEELQPAPGATLGMTEFDLYPELRGPQGTVPFLRPTFVQYVLEAAEATSIADFIRRHQALGMPAGQNRLYAGLVKTASNTAAYG